MDGYRYDCSRNVLYVLVGSIFIGYIVLKKYYNNYWRRTNGEICTIKRTSILGAVLNGVELSSTPFGTFYKSVYDDIGPNKKCAWLYIFRNRKLVLRNADLIKSVLSIDFDHFQHRNTIPFDKRQPITMHLFTVFGEQWKNLRTISNPSFTPAKTKLMFDQVKLCAEELQHSIEKSAEIGCELEIRDVMASYTIQVISSCAFGLHSNSVRNPDSKFKEIAIRMTGCPSFQIYLRNLFAIISPTLSRLLNLPLVDKEVVNFFNSVIGETIKYREENNVKRNDFLGSLIDIKNASETSVNSKNGNANGVGDGEKLPSNNIKPVKHTIEVDSNVITAQCSGVFFAGFESSSSVASFALLEVARNPDVGRKLYEEVDKVWNECNGNFNYESLKNLTYMEKVILETMRIYPVLPILTRQCTKEYRIPDTDIVIEKGTDVVIPVCGLHNDPEHFPNPEIFDPERFSENAKEQRHRYAYLAFGEGPRMCLGMKFAMMQLKVGLTMFLKHYEVQLSSRTKLPVKIPPKIFIPKCEGGIWIRLVKRS